ncbi:MAG: class I SAM-dependent methyltransferase [Promethearchaeota archaeon]
MKKKIIRMIWYFFDKIPKLKNTIYRFYAWRIFEIVPYFKKLIYKAYDKFWFIELLIENKNFDPSKYQINSYKINLNRINYSIQTRDNILVDLSNLTNDWDSSEGLIPIVETREYNLLESRLIKKLKWDDIGAYNDFIDKITSNQPVAGCLNQREFLKFLDSLENTYKNFKPNKPIENIKVGIERGGNFVVFGGLFIVSLLKLLKAKDVPIDIVIRHPLWLKFSSDFLKFQSIHGELYQPLIHPDLRYKSSYTDQRFVIISQNLTIEKGSLLDIGANLAYFCHKFEDLGFDCYAVEIRPSNVHYMKKLRDIEGKKFKIINKSIFDLNEKLDYDIVLALNIFHHFLREKELYQNLIKFLGRLKLRTMYFQPHNPGENIMRNAFVNYDNEQFVRFIIKHSCLNKFKLINKQSDGRTRPIYKIFK